MRFLCIYIRAIIFSSSDAFIFIYNIILRISICIILLLFIFRDIFLYLFCFSSCRIINVIAIVLPPSITLIGIDYLLRIGNDTIEILIFSKPIYATIFIYVSFIMKNIFNKPIVQFLNVNIADGFFDFLKEIIIDGICCCRLIYIARNRNFFTINCRAVGNRRAFSECSARLNLAFFKEACFLSTEPHIKKFICIEREGFRRSGLLFFSNAQCIFIDCRICCRLL